MTNFEAWHYYMKDVTSPESFVTMSYYSMIAAALQRRVYLGSDEWPLFANMFIVLCGDPGVGKGQALKPVVELLKRHKLGNLKIKKPDTTEEQAEMLASLIAEMDTTNGKQPNGAFRKMTNLEEPLLFPLGPSSTTYEALVKAHAQSIRNIFPEHDKKSKLLKSGLYVHSSMSVFLEEMSSLFRKHTEDLVQYIIKAYDCEDYKYVTIGRGSDKVINSYLNICAGTTPAFVRENLNEKLLNDGFTARVFFVYESRSRFYRFDFASFSPEQIAAKEQVNAQIAKLGTLFGQVSYSPEAHYFMKHYIEVVLGEKRIRTNPDPKLAHYYARKNIHVQKLAMVMHFSESTDMVIQLPTCEAAIRLLDSLEMRMHLAVSGSGRNPLMHIAEKVIKAVNENPMSQEEIWAKFFGDITSPLELQNLIDFLVNTKRMKLEMVNGKFKYKSMQINA